MHVYEDTVIPGDMATRPRVLSVDGATVEVLFPNSQKRLSFELVFDCIEDSDAFLVSKRKKVDARRHGGRIVLMTPMHLVDASLDAPQDELPTRKQLKTVAELVGISVEDLRIAERIAWNAILATYL
ncbi:MAG: hypothetical protein Q8O19_05705 [Rectinemataceae bacterium]|nr:hypothetical protein [Rectinemataceae bacterium]